MNTANKRYSEKDALEIVVKPHAKYFEMFSRFYKIKNLELATVQILFNETLLVELLANFGSKFRCIALLNLLSCYMRQFESAV